MTTFPIDNRNNISAAPADLDALRRVAALVPAGCISQLRKQPPHRGLGLRIA